MSDPFLTNLRKRNNNLHLIDNSLLTEDKLASDYNVAGPEAGYRLAVGNNRLTQGNIPQELNLTRALRLRETLLTSMPYSSLVGGHIPSAILTPNQEVVGGGNLEGGAAVDVMRHLEKNPDVNFRKLTSIYVGLRSELQRKTGKNVDSTFDTNMISKLNDLRDNEREVRASLVRMNLVQNLAPFTKHKGDWDDVSLSKEAADAIAEFSKLEAVKTGYVLSLNNLLIRFGAAIGRL